jgi:hypothetical protein
VLAPTGDQALLDLGGRIADPLVHPVLLLRQVEGKDWHDWQHLREVSLVERLPLFQVQRPRLDSHEAPRELTREGVFSVLLEECYRDGLIDEEETTALEGVARILDIGSNRQSELTEAARARYQAQELPPGGAMDPEQLMERLRVVAEADGVVTPSEEALLGAIEHYLRVGVED